MSQDVLTRDLLERAKAGDDDAFAKLWDRYWPRLLEWVDGKIDRRLQSRLDAEDILQTVFRTFHRHLPSGRYVIEERGKLWCLLIGIAANKIWQQREQQTAQKRDYGQERPLTTALLDMVATGKPSVELSLALRDEVDAVLLSLSPPEVEIARLAIWEEGSLREIAQTTKTSLSSVRRIMTRVTTLLKSRLTD